MKINEVVEKVKANWPILLLGMAIGCMSFMLVLNRDEILARIKRPFSAR